MRDLGGRLVLSKEAYSSPEGNVKVNILIAKENKVEIPVNGKHLEELSRVTPVQRAVKGNPRQGKTLGD